MISFYQELEKQKQNLEFVRIVKKIIHLKLIKDIFVKGVIKNLMMTKMKKILQLTIQLITQIICLIIEDMVIVII